MTVGHVRDLFDFGGTLSESIRVDLGSLAGLGVRSGAFAGVVFSDVSWRNRLTIAVAMLGEFLVEVFIVPWAGVPILFGIVAVTSWANKRSSPSLGSLAGGGASEALHPGWASSFGAAIGGIPGRIVGLVFMGAAGVVVGEALGDPVIAAAALYAPAGL